MKRGRKNKVKERRRSKIKAAWMGEERGREEKSKEGGETGRVGERRRGPERYPVLGERRAGRKEDGLNEGEGKRGKTGGKDSGFTASTETAGSVAGDRA